MLNKTSLLIKKRNRYRLIVIISPTNATDKKVIWSINNKKVAKVDIDGNITAIEKGQQ